MSPVPAGVLQLLALMAALALAYRPLGDYMARVYSSDKHLRVEKWIYKAIGANPNTEMRWPAYLRGVPPPPQADAERMPATDRLAQREETGSHGFPTGNRAPSASTSASPTSPFCPTARGQNPRPSGRGASQILITPALVLCFTAVAMALPTPGNSMRNSGAHGFSEILYAYTSAANNNGSAFAGLNADTQWFNTTLGVVMLLGRFLPMVFVLALAGSLAEQKPVPATAGTLRTEKPLFTGLLVGASWSSPV